MTTPNSTIEPFKWPADWLPGEYSESAVDVIAVDDRDHTLDVVKDYADILWGDVVLVPFVDGEPDWPNINRGTLQPFAGHWAELEQDDVPRLAVLTDTFDRFTSDGSGIDASVITLWRNGNPVIQQIGGEPCEAAVDLIMTAIANDEPLEKVACGVAELDACMAAAKRPANDNKPGIHSKPSAFVNAQDLLGMQFPPVNFIVPGFVSEGLTLLGGRPKLGKSWLALDMCIAIASGGRTLGADCEQGDVIYLALEDNQRRLQDRLKKLLPPLKSLRPDLSRLSLLTEAPKIGAGLIEALDTWRLGVEHPRLIVIDTLAMVRPSRGRTQDAYEADYAAVSPLQKYAGQHRVGVMVVTHVRKMEAADPLEMISGTNGVTGAADSILVLNRDSDGPKLYGRGRDIEEVEKALRFEAGKWSVLGDADDVKRSGQRKQILAAFEESQAAMSPKEIADAASLKPANVKYLLREMVKAGELEKLEYGSYRPAQAA